MRKYLSRAVLSVLLLVFLSACASWESLRPFPYGIWENADLGLVLDINPQRDSELSQFQFRGTYVEAGENIDVYVTFVVTHANIWILRVPEWPGMGPHGHESTLFGGRYRVRGGQLHYTLMQRYQEQHGLETIIFEKIYSYDVAD